MSDRSGTGSSVGSGSCGRCNGGGGKNRKVRATLRCRYSDRDVASGVREAIEPDNEGYVTSYINRSSLVAEAESDSPRSLRSTLDDLLACLGTAERVMRPEPGSPDRVKDDRRTE